MDINALRVFDALHKLNISEDAYRDLQNEVNTDHTGIYFGAIVKNLSIGINHDNKHSLFIRHAGKDLKEKTRILFKTYITFKDLPDEIYTLHKALAYRSQDKEIKQTANNLEELKKIIIERLSDGYPKELGMSVNRNLYSYDETKNYHKDKINMIEKELKATCWLFGESGTPDLGDTRTNISKIIKVFQKDNKRLAIIQKSQKTGTAPGWFGANNWRGNIEYLEVYVKIYSPNDPQYNYACPGREVYFNYNFEIWIDAKVSLEELQIISETEKGFILLNADSYNKYYENIRLKVARQERENIQRGIKEKIVNKIKEDFKGGKVVRSGIEFTPKSFSYLGLKISGPKLNEFYSYNNILYLETPEFRKIYENYITYLLKASDTWNGKRIVSFQGTFNLQVGNMNILYEKDRNAYINKYRVSFLESEELLKNAISFKDQKSYDNYVMCANKIPLKIQDYIKKGFKFDIKIERSQENCLAKDSIAEIGAVLKYENNKLYIKIRDKFLRVTDRNSLILLTETIEHKKDEYVNRSIKLLFKAVSEITPKDISILIRDGVKIYKRQKAKEEKENKIKLENSLRFIENAVRLSKAVKTEQGYLVTGTSGTVYLVKDNLQVRIMKENKEYKYLCILDIGTENTEWGKNDAIAKRLLALSKDESVARDIYNNGDKMDSWWLNLRMAGAT